MLAQQVFHSTPLHACLLCGHAYPTRPHGMLVYLWTCLPNQTTWHACLSVDMLTQPDHMACLPDLWACLPITHSTTWHAFLICGYAYPSRIPPHGMPARSVGMLTHPALRHIACLLDLWACLPILHSATLHACRICGHAYPSRTPLHGMLARSVGMLTHPALHYMACLPGL